MRGLTEQSPQISQESSVKHHIQLVLSQIKNGKVVTHMNRRSASNFFLETRGTEDSTNLKWGPGFCLQNCLQKEHFFPPATSPFFLKKIPAWEDSLLSKNLNTKSWNSHAHMATETSSLQQVLMSYIHSHPWPSQEPDEYILSSPFTRGSGRSIHLLRITQWGEAVGLESKPEFLTSMLYSREGQADKKAPVADCLPCRSVEMVLEWCWQVTRFWHRKLKHTQGEPASGLRQGLRLTITDDSCLADPILNNFGELGHSFVLFNPSD